MAEKGIVNFRLQNRYGRVLLCVALSVLLHGVLGALLLQLPPQDEVKRTKAHHKSRAVKVVRTEARKKAGVAPKQQAGSDQPPEMPRKQKPTVKVWPSTSTPSVPSMTVAPCRM